MKRIMCVLMLLIITACCCTSALAEQCKYAGQGSACEVGWWVDTETRMHARACFYHVEDKEDMNSHVLITDWTYCTVDEVTGECSGCGWDYVKEPSSEDYEIYMREFYAVLSEMNGTAPVDVSVSGNRLTISMTDDFFAFMDDMGVPYSESMMVETEFTLTLPGGTTYPATGSAVTPAAEVKASQYGPGSWLQKYGLLEIGKVTYANNTEPGKATASVKISVENGKSYTLTQNFTIDGSAPKPLPGDSDQDGVVGLSDALAILRYCAGEIASINQQNADVNGDGTVNLYDALRIFQYEAGWNVSFE